jgi:hypothetical protein
MLGGVGLFSGMLANARPEYYPNNAASLWIDRYANVIDTPLYALGLVLLSVGQVGLLLRYGKRSGGLGQIGLVLGALSGLVAAAGAVGLSLNDSEPWWSFFFLGLVTQFLGLALFGLANTRQRSLPRWNLLPVITGLGLPALAISSLIVERVNGRFVETPAVIVLLVMVLTVAGLFGLGYLLQTDSQAAPQPAAVT